MRHLFTVFDLLWLVLPPALATAGGFVGNRFGVIGIVLGVLLGFVVGCSLGRLPMLLGVRAFHRRIADKSAADLRATLRNSDIDLDYPPNFVLLELNRRGEVTLADLWSIFDMLESADVARRRCGVAAITSAFPDIADKAPDYLVNDTLEECERKIRALREHAEQSFGTDGGTPCGNQGG